ncbi:hypothetical protein [Sporisorium scitamineum]|uniref:Uncharacterized protein n=1 Tax=Sporisorium scitamineum TaxID=49012 RepID=A0A0F7RZZ8_9BASI|nr:hypothetical protein [Sporisorium scitamineum]
MPSMLLMEYAKTITQPLGEIICEYNVASTNIFNVDETGFMFGNGGDNN